MGIFLFDMNLKTIALPSPPTMPENVLAEHTKKAKECGKFSNDILLGVSVNRAIIPESSAIYKAINTVYSKISTAARKPNLHLNIIDDNNINAFHIPFTNEIYLHLHFMVMLEKYLLAKGKVLTEDHIASLFGHEIVHALQDHSSGDTDIFKSHTKTQEYDADFRGMQLATKAGYNPWATLEIFDFLDSLGNNALFSIFSTHPYSKDRRAQLESYLRDPEVYIKGKSSTVYTKFDIPLNDYPASFELTNPDSLLMKHSIQDSKRQLRIKDNKNTETIKTAIDQARTLFELQSIYNCYKGQPINGLESIFEEKLKSFFPETSQNQIKLIFLYLFELNYSEFHGNYDEASVDYANSQIDKLQRWGADPSTKHDKDIGYELFKVTSENLTRLSDNEIRQLFKTYNLALVKASGSDVNKLEAKHFLLLKLVLSEIQKRKLIDNAEIINDLCAHLNYVNNFKSLESNVIALDVGKIISDLLMSEFDSSPERGIAILASLDLPKEIIGEIVQKLSRQSSFVHLSLQEKLSFLESLKNAPEHTQELYVLGLLGIGTNDRTPAIMFLNNPLSGLNNEDFWTTVALLRSHLAPIPSYLDRSVSSLEDQFVYPPFSKLMEVVCDSIIRDRRLTTKEEIFRFLKGSEGKFPLTENQLIKLVSPFVSEFSDTDFLFLNNWVLSHNLSPSRYQSHYELASSFRLLSFLASKDYRPKFLNPKDMRQIENTVWIREIPWDTILRTEADVEALLKRIGKTNDTLLTGLLNNDVYIMALKENKGISAQSISAGKINKYPGAPSLNGDADRYLENYDSYPDIGESLYSDLSRPKLMHLYIYTQNHEDYKHIDLSDLQKRTSFYLEHFSIHELPNSLLSSEAEKHLLSYWNQLLQNSGSSQSPCQKRSISLYSSEGLRNPKTDTAYPYQVLSWEGQIIESQEQLSQFKAAFQAVRPLLIQEMTRKYLGIINHYEEQLSPETFNSARTFIQYLKTYFPAPSLFRDDVILSFINNDDCPIRRDEINQFTELLSLNLGNPDNKSDNKGLMNLISVMSDQIGPTQKAQLLLFFLSGDREHIPDSIRKYGQSQAVRMDGLRQAFLSSSKSERQEILEQLLLGEKGVMANSDSLSKEEKERVAQEIDYLRVQMTERHSTKKLQKVFYDSPYARSFDLVTEYVSPLEESSNYQFSHKKAYFQSQLTRDQIRLKTDELDEINKPLFLAIDILIHWVDANVKGRYSRERIKLEIKHPTSELDLSYDLKQLATEDHKKEFSELVSNIKTELSQRNTKRIQAIEQDILKSLNMEIVSIGIGKTSDDLEREIKSLNSARPAMQHFYKLKLVYPQYAPGKSSKDYEEQFANKKHQAAAVEKAINVSAFNVFLGSFVDMLFDDTFNENLKNKISSSLLILFEQYPPYRRVHLLADLISMFAEESHAPMEVKIRKLFEVTGATGIKVAQFLAEKPEIVPNETIRSELAKSRERVESFSRASVFSATNEEVWEITDKRGSASIKRVDEGNGKTIIIKTRRPNLMLDLEEDKRVLPLLGKEFDLNVNDAFIESTKQEGDFRLEAENQKKLKHNLDGHRFGTFDYHVPEVYSVSDDGAVMIEEPARGQSLSQIWNRVSTSEQTDISSSVADAFFHQVFVDGFFHADLHKGNIFVDGSTLTLIDSGLCGKATSQQKFAYLDFLIAFSSNNPKRLENNISAYFLSKGNISRETKINLRNISANPQSSSEAKMQQILKELSGYKLKSEFVVFLKALAAISPYIDSINADNPDIIQKLIGKSVRSWVQSLSKSDIVTLFVRNPLRVAVYLVDPSLR